MWLQTDKAQGFPLVYAAILERNLDSTRSCSTCRALQGGRLFSPAEMTPVNLFSKLRIPEQVGGACCH